MYLEPVCSASQFGELLLAVYNAIDSGIVRSAARIRVLKRLRIAISGL
jgi:hypothetical protein